MAKKGPRPPAGLTGGLMDKMSQMQAEMDRAQESLADERLTVTAGGQAITVVIDGRQRLHHILISPEALAAAQSDPALLQDLLVAAINSALEQSQTLAAERLRALGQDLGLPGM